jgi:hypothetical protein
MSTRREFMTAGGAAALAALSTTASAEQQHGVSIYLHGMVWNRQAPAPMHDWLVRLDAKADILFGNAAQPATPGFATLGDDFHDNLGSHVEIHTATLHADRLTLAGFVTESRDGSLDGLSIRIEGKVQGTSVEGLTVTIGADTFTGAGLLVVIAIIAILIA